MHRTLPALPLRVELDDGTPLLLRLGTPGDRDALLAGFERLSPESRLSRFFTATPRLSSVLLDRLLEVDELHQVAVVAQDLSRASDVVREPDGLGVGVGRYIVYEADATRAEIAVAVIDEYQGRGIGRLLLDALVGYGLDHGVTTFVARMLASNEPMLAIAADMGAIVEWDPDDREVVSIEVPITDELLARSHLAPLLRRAAADGAATSPRP